MIPTTEYSTRSKESALWALAQQDPDFSAFYTEYREKITLTAPLPVELLDGVVEVVEQDPALAPAVKRYLENAQTASAFAAPGLPEAGILIAALFLLGTHIRFHKTKDGKWEFLLEHPASEDGVLERIVQILSEIFKR